MRKGLEKYNPDKGTLRARSLPQLNMTSENLARWAFASQSYDDQKVTLFIFSNHR